MIKSFLSKEFKLSCRVLLNLVGDTLNGYLFSFAKMRKEKIDYLNKITLAQELKPNPLKLINLRLAIGSIEAIDVMPNEIFSFWRVVGEASKRNGFVESRSIVNNRIENSMGGGLCQLSGIIYHICLVSDLEIVERHNHSMDIYNEETRFTPLGADATVAYGYKDLKIRNTRDTPIRFSFAIDDHKLTIEMHFSNKLKKRAVNFEEISRSATRIEVATKIGGAVIEKSVYKIPNNELSRG